VRTAVIAAAVVILGLAVAPAYADPDAADAALATARICSVSHA